MLEILKRLYYSLEDMYYGVLDRLNEKAPVYQIVDPIDRVFPSFILCIAAFFAILFIMFSLFLGQSGALAKFGVLDPSGEPLEGAEVVLAAQGRVQEKTSDSFGEFETDLIGKGIAVRAKHDGFEDFNDTIDIEPQKKYTISMGKKAIVVVSKRISFELRDEQHELIDSAALVSMSFTCSKYVNPPSVSGKGGTHSISVQSNCGTLTATINAQGFDELNRQGDVLAQEGTVVVVLSKKQLFASVGVVAKDAETMLPLEGVRIKFKKGDVTALDGGTTDSSGSKIVQRVPAGDYVIEAIPSDNEHVITFSGEFSVTAAQFSSGEPLSVEVLVKKSEGTAKSLSVKFIDSQDSKPVKDVEATLVIESQKSVTLNSGEDGIVKFAKLDDKNTYSVIAYNPKYVLFVARNLKVNTAPVEIKLAKATSLNSGAARVIALDSAGAGITDADIQLYSRQLPFSIRSGKTGSGGKIDLTGLPAGDYYAKAGKVIDGIAHENKSDQKSITAGSMIEFPIELVVANANMQVIVKGEDGKPIANARIFFRDFLSRGNRLEDKNSLSDGTSGRVELRAARPLYLEVSKQGYYTFFSQQYTLVPGETRTINITLRPAGSAGPDFDIQLNGIFDASGRKANRLEENKEYFFGFEMVFSKPATDAKALIRTGLETEKTPADINVLIKSVSSAGAALFASCYSQTDQYAGCDGAPVDFTALGAKQAVLSFGNPSPSIYEIVVKVKIRDIAAGMEATTPVEIRYGAKAQIGGQQAYRKGISELYLWSMLLNKPFCTSECGFLIELKIQDKNAKQFAQAHSIQSGSVTELLADANYNIYYEITNLSNEPAGDLSLKLTNDNGINPSLLLPLDNFQIGRLAWNSSFKGSFSFSTPRAVESTALDFNLSVKRKGDFARAIFKVTGIKPMQLSLSPGSLLPNQKNTIVVKATDGTNNPVKNADIAIYEMPQGPQIMAGTTDDGGFYSARFDAPYAQGEFDVNATRIGYSPASKRIGVGGIERLAGAQCLTIDGKPIGEAPLEISQRGGEKEFTLKNSSCSQDAAIRIGKHPDSDMRLSKGGTEYDLALSQEFVLKNNEQVSLKARPQNQFGVHPLFFSAKLGSSATWLDAGAARVSIFDNSVCLFLERSLNEGGVGGEKFLVDMMGGPQTLEYINRCFTGTQEGQYPSNDISTMMDEKVLVAISNSVKNIPQSLSRQQLELRNIGLTSQGYFLISVQDYVKGGP